MSRQRIFGLGLLSQQIHIAGLSRGAIGAMMPWWEAVGPDGSSQNPGKTGKTLENIWIFHESSMNDGFSYFS